MSDIFISYAHQDRSFASRLATVLGQRGWSVFWDRRIPVGKVFDQVIEQQLDAAQCLIVLWSEHSIVSDWVKTEASEGARRGVLHPALISDVKIPLEFRRLQTARLVDWQPGSPHEEFDQFLGDITRTLAVQSGAATPFSDAQGPLVARDSRAGVDDSERPADAVPTDATDRRAPPAIASARSTRVWMVGAVLTVLVAVAAIGITSWRAQAPESAAGGDSPAATAPPSTGQTAASNAPTAPDEAQALYLTGRKYEHGDGVARDYMEAVKWYRQAAERGYAPAQKSLGFFYGTGQGVAKDDVEAAKWYLKGAEQGDRELQRIMGTRYELGTGVPVDPQEAMKWYRKAADQGDSLGAKNLGVMYGTGKGVAQNEEEAATWYRKAADLGDAESQSALGARYRIGLGVRKDQAQAVFWYRKAARQGFKAAQDALEQLGLKW